MGLEHVKKKYQPIFYYKKNGTEKGSSWDTIEGAEWEIDRTYRGFLDHEVEPFNYAEIKTVYLPIDN
ncbi:hypothetical protein QO179_25100 [Bacillus stercoris]|nr:hypothetical protein [Bacillus stercoris]